MTVSCLCLATNAERSGVFDVERFRWTGCETDRWATLSLEEAISDRRSPISRSATPSDEKRHTVLLIHGLGSHQEAAERAQLKTENFDCAIMDRRTRP